MTPAEQLVRHQLQEDLERRGTADLIFDSMDQSLAESARAMGRAIGRARGWRIRTIATRGESTIRVWVVVREADPLHTQLWETRSDKVMRRAIQAL